MEFKTYCPDDQKVGLVIHEPDLVLVSVSGDAQNVDNFVHELVRFWTIQPDSNVVWHTADGCAPQRDEPACAQLFMRIHRLQVMREGDPTLGLKSNVCSRQEPEATVS